MAKKTLENKEEKYTNFISEIFTDNYTVGFAKIDKKIIKENFNYSFSKVNIEFLKQAITILSNLKIREIWIGMDNTSSINPILMKTKRDKNSALVICCIGEKD